MLLPRRVAVVAVVGRGATATATTTTRVGALSMATKATAAATPATAAKNASPFGLDAMGWWRRLATDHVRRALQDRHVTRVVHGALATRATYDKPKFKLHSLVTMPDVGDVGEMRRLVAEEEEETCFLVLSPEPLTWVKAVVDSAAAWDWAKPRSSLLVGGPTAQIADALIKVSERGWKGEVVDPDVVGFGPSPSSDFACLEVFGSEEYLGESREEFD